MVIRLYDETPIHQENFRKLVAEAFYDSTTFHRVIGGFMIQGGDPNSKDDDPANDGEGDPGYTLEAEFNPAFFHKRGALAAARQPDSVNPEQRSSGSQFYIVHGGRPIPAEVLTQMQAQLRDQREDPDFTYAEAAVAAYTTSGGAPHLDGEYTIFGELVEGFDVLDAIAATPTARSTGRQVPPLFIDRPFEPIPMTIRALPDYGK
jgi:peptidyl-prolyl cis-trans isomerase B (cyclophilin B)